MARTKERQSLTPGEARFIDVYCQTLNATEAARQAFPDSKAPRALASLVRKRHHVSVEISRRLGEKSEWANAARREVIEVLVAAMRANIADCYKDGQLIPLSQMKPEVKIALADYSEQTNEITTQKSIRIKLMPKLGTARLLAEMLGMLRERDPLEAERAELDDADKLLTSRMAELAERLAKAPVAESPIPA